jgi:hypothetical protein
MDDRLDEIKREGANGHDVEWRVQGLNDDRGLVLGMALETAGCHVEIAP